MKMRKTKIKFMSLLLAVMMIVGVLPTTALAATYNDVKVNGVSLVTGSILRATAQRTPTIQTRSHRAMSHGIRTAL